MTPLAALFVRDLKLAVRVGGGAGIDYDALCDDLAALWAAGRRAVPQECGTSTGCGGSRRLATTPASTDALARPPPWPGDGPHNESGDDEPHIGSLEASVPPWQPDAVFVRRLSQSLVFAQVVSCTVLEAVLPTPDHPDFDRPAA